MEMEILLYQVADDAVLIITAVGYETQEISVNDRTDFNLMLKQAIKSQEQIVVIGYGAARKKVPYRCLCYDKRK